MSGHWGLIRSQGLEENFDIPPKNRLARYGLNLAHQPSIKLEIMTSDQSIIGAILSTEI